MTRGGTHAYFDDNINAAVWEISGFVSFDDFSKAGEETHKLRQQHGSNKQLNNIKNMKILSKDIQLWIDDVFFPTAQRTGLKYFAFVIPANTFGKLSMESVNKDASEKYAMEIKYFEEENLARTWLLSK